MNIFLDKIGQNLEIFPVDDTGLRLRKIFKIFKKFFFFCFFVKCIEQLMKHILGQNLEIFPAGDTGLLFCCEMYRKLMNNFLGH